MRVCMMAVRMSVQTVERRGTLGSSLDMIHPSHGGDACSFRMHRPSRPGCRVLLSDTMTLQRTCWRRLPPDRTQSADRGERALRDLWVSAHPLATVCDQLH